MAKIQLSAKLGVDLALQKNDLSALLAKLQNDFKKMKLPSNMTSSLEDDFKRIGDKFQKYMAMDITPKNAKFAQKAFNELTKEYTAFEHNLKSIGGAVVQIAKEEYEKEKATLGLLEDQLKVQQKLANASNKTKTAALNKKAQDIVEPQNRRRANLIAVNERLAAGGLTPELENQLKTRQANLLSKIIEENNKYKAAIAERNRLKQQNIDANNEIAKIMPLVTNARTVTNTAHQNLLATKAQAIPKDTMDQFINLKENIMKAGGAVDEFAEKNKRASGSVGYMASQLAYMTSGAYAVTKAFQGFRSIVSIVTELDKSLTEIAEVSGMTRNEVWALLPTFQALAEKMGATQQQIADAARLYYQQGLTTAETMKVVESTSVAASLAGIKFAEATDRMTSAIRGFNMEYSDSMRVTDVYSKLAATTAADFNELSYAMTKTASIAATAGMSFENTTAFLAKMIETTREAPENIGTAMKSIIARMTELTNNPTKALEDGTDLNKVQEVLRSVGVEFTDLNGEIIPLDQTIVKLGEKWDTLDRNTQAYIATTIAGNRQQSRFLALMSNFDRTMELSQEAFTSSGAAASMFTTHLTGVEVASNRLAQAQQKLATKLLEADTLIDLKMALAGLLNILNEMPTVILYSGLAITPVIAKLVAAKVAAGGFADGMFRLQRDIWSGGQIDKNRFWWNNLDNPNSRKNLKKQLSDIQEEMMDLYDTQANKKGPKTKQYKADMAALEAQLLSTQEKIKKTGKAGLLANRGLQKLGKGAKMLGMSFAAAIPQMAAMVAIGLAISGIVALIQRKQKRIDKAKENIDMATQAIDKIQQESDEITRLSKSYDDLNSKFGKSQEEQEELKNTLNEIALIFPELVTGYDEYGNAVLKNSANVTEALKKQQQENAKLVNQKNQERMQSAISLFQDDTFSDEITAKQDKLKELYKQQDKYVGHTKGGTYISNQEEYDKIQVQISDLKKQIESGAAAEIVATYKEYGRTLAQAVLIGFTTGNDESDSVIQTELVSLSGAYVDALKVKYGEDVEKWSKETQQKMDTELQAILKHRQKIFADDALNAPSLMDIEFTSANIQTAGDQINEIMGNMGGGGALGNQALEDAFGYLGKGKVDYKEGIVTTAYIDSIDIDDKVADKLTTDFSGIFSAGTEKELDDTYLKLSEQVDSITNETAGFVGLEPEVLAEKKAAIQDLLLLYREAKQQELEMSTKRQEVLGAMGVNPRESGDFAQIQGQVENLSTDQTKGLYNLVSATDTSGENFKQFLSDSKIGIDELGVSLETLQDGWNPSSALKFFNSVSKKAKLTEDQISQLNNVILETFSASDFEDNASKQIGELAKIEDSYTTLNSAIDEYNKNGSMSANMLQSLVNSGLIQYLDLSNGKLSLQADALLEVADAAKEEAIASLYAAAAIDLAALQSGDFTDASERMKNIAVRSGITAETYGGKLVGLAVATGSVGIASQLTIKSVNDFAASVGNSTREMQRAESTYRNYSNSVIGNSDYIKAYNAYMDDLEDTANMIQGIVSNFASGMNNTTYSTNNATDAATTLLDRYFQINQELEYQNYLLEKNQKLIDDAADDVAKRLKLERERVALLQKQLALEKEKWTIMRGEGNSVMRNLDAYKGVKASYNSTTHQYEVTITGDPDKWSEKKRAAVNELIETIATINADLLASLTTMFDIKEEIEDLAFSYEKAANILSEILQERFDYRKSAIEYQRDNDPLLKALESQIEALEARKKLFEESKDELAEMTEEIEKQKKLLLDLRGERNKAVYTEGQGWTWQVDQTAIDEAEKTLNDMYYDLSLAKLDEQIKLLTTQKENQEKYYEDALKLLEDQEKALQYMVDAAKWKATKNDLSEAQFKAMLVENGIKGADLDKLMEMYTNGLNAVDAAIALLGVAKSNSSTYDSGGIADGKGYLSKQIRASEIVLGPQLSKKLLDPRKSAEFSRLEGFLDSMTSGRLNLAEAFSTGGIVPSGITNTSNQAVYHFEKLILPNVTNAQSFIDELNALKNIAATRRNL